MAGAQKMKLGKRKIDLPIRVEESTLKNFFHGSWTASNSVSHPPMKRKRLSIEVFESEEKARKRLKDSQIFDNEYLLKTHFLQNYEGITFVVGEPVFDDWRKWIRRTELKIWDYRCKKNGDEVCVGLGDDFQKVSRGILRYLEALHEKKTYHGNLLQCITVSESSEVKIIGFCTCKDLAAGIENDLRDFENFVREVVKCHPVKQGLNEPDALQLFYSLLKDMLECPKHFKKNSFFVYHNAVFWNGLQRYYFSKKIGQLSSFEPFFMEGVSRQQEFLSMKDWSSVIDENSKLRGVLNYRDHFSYFYKYPDGFIPFLKNTYKHYWEATIVKTLDLDKLGIEDLLYEHLPNVCPLLFHWLASNLDPRRAKKFGCDVLAFLKKEPSAFHLSI